VLSSPSPTGRAGRRPDGDPGGAAFGGAGGARGVGRPPGDRPLPPAATAPAHRPPPSRAGPVGAGAAHRDGHPREGGNPRGCGWGAPSPTFLHRPLPLTAVSVSVCGYPPIGRPPGAGQRAGVVRRPRARLRPRPGRRRGLPFDPHPLLPLHSPLPSGRPPPCGRSSTRRAKPPSSWTRRWTPAPRPPPPTPAPPSSPTSPTSDRWT